MAGGTQSKNVVATPLMSRVDTARALGGLHLATINKFVRAGKLERVFVGRRSMVTVASVEALIESGRTQPTPGLYRKAMAPIESARQ
jgi:hypothetical protein